MITPAEWSAIFNSLWVASAALLVSLPAGVALGWLLARKRFPGKMLLEVLVLLPLVMPPVVTGYILLVAFSRRGWLGSAIHRWLGADVLFTGKAMVIAAAVVGLPLLVRSVRLAMEAVDPRLEQAARTLGRTRLATFFEVTLRLAWPGVVTGSALFFARALGEFGATRLVALNADGTRTIALEVFQQLEQPGAGDWAVMRLAVFSIVLSAACLAACEVLSRRHREAAP